MFLIISKWSPNSPDAKYIPLQMVAEIISTENNSADNQPIIPNQYFNKQVFMEWMNAARNFRNCFSDGDFINYDTYVNPANSEIITLQVYKNDVKYRELLQTEERASFNTARQNFLNLIDVTMTAKFSSQQLTELPPNYAVAAQMFEDSASSLD
jgi:hypothetical protein